MDRCRVCEGALDGGGWDCPACDFTYHCACDPGYCVNPDCRRAPEAIRRASREPARRSRAGALQLLLHADVVSTDMGYFRKRFGWRFAWGLVLGAVLLGRALGDRVDGLWHPDVGAQRAQTHESRH